MQSTLYITLSVSVISMLSLIGGGFLNVSKKTIARSIPLLVSFAAGAMIAASFLNILPEALEQGAIPTVLYATLIGIIFSFFIERSVLFFHHHHDDTHNITPSAYLVLIGDSLHNFVDGVSIAASFLIHPAVGLSTTIAIAFHEIPQEIADYSILIHSGLSRKQALLSNFVSALTAFVGAYLGIYFIEQFSMLLPLILGFTAGTFIYISCADLIPDLHSDFKKQSGHLQTIIFVAGVVLMALLTMTLSHSSFFASQHNSEVHTFQ